MIERQSITKCTLTVLCSTLLAAALPLNGYAAALGDAVKNVGTTLQTNTGNSVQAVCGKLAAQFTADPNSLPAPQKNLFFRCREMVNTANSLLNNAGPKANQLDLTAAQLAKALQQLAGEENGSRSRLATESSNGQFANIGMRMSAIRQGARVAATGGSSLLAIDYRPETGKFSFAGSGGGDADDGTGWSWYTNGAVGFGDRDGTKGEDQYDYDSYGVTVGADYGFNNGLILGGALGYSDFQADFDNLSNNVLTSSIAGGNLETDGYSFSVYGIRDIGRISFDALITYGRNDFDLDRAIKYQAGSGAGGTQQGGGVVANTILHGHTDSDQWAGGLNATTAFDWGRTNMNFEIGVKWLSIQIDGYQESDPQGSGLNLAYRNQNVDSVQSRLGFHFRRTISTRKGVISPYLNIAWLHEFRNEGDALVSRYVNALNKSKFENIIARTDDPDEDFFEVGFGVSAAFAGNTQAFLQYELSAGLKYTNSNLITLGIRRPL